MTDLDENQTAKKQSPGELLVAGRLRAGLSQEYVAKELFMPVTKVKALESDQFSQLNSDIFVRGYIRAYARLLQLNANEIIAAYDELLVATKPKTEHLSTGSVTQSSQRVAWKFLLVIGAFLFGLWLISVWFFDNRSEREYPSVASVAASLSPSIDNLPVVTKSSAMVASVAQIQAQSSVASQVISNKSVASSIVVAVAASSKASAQPVSSSSASKTAAAVVVNSGVVTDIKVPAAKNDSTNKKTLDEITFSFRAESWLEVSDSRGDVLATELQAAGSHITLMGRAPFDVKLGNAPGVDIQMNGKQIPVVPVAGAKVLILKVSN